jgi:hypothetical protein
VIAATLAVTEVAAAADATASPAARTSNVVDATGAANSLLHPLLQQSADCPYCQPTDDRCGG